MKLMVWFSPPVPVHLARNHSRHYEGKQASSTMRWSSSYRWHSNKLSQSVCNNTDFTWFDVPFLLDFSVHTAHALSFWSCPTTKFDRRSMPRTDSSLIICMNLSGHARLFNPPEVGKAPGRHLSDLQYFSQFSLSCFDASSLRCWQKLLASISLAGKAFTTAKQLPYDRWNNMISITLESGGCEVDVLCFFEAWVVSSEAYVTQVDTGSKSGSWG